MAKIPLLPFEITRIRKHTLLHPDYKKSIRHAFTIDDTEYYEFKNIADMPFERYFSLADIEQEGMLGITHEELLRLADETIKHVEQTGNSLKAVTNWEIVKRLLSIPANLDLLYKKASVIYFTKDEDLREWDADYNAHKIETFKKKGYRQMLLETPIGALINFEITSAKDLQDYLSLVNTNRELRRLASEYAIL